MAARFRRQRPEQTRLHQLIEQHYPLFGACMAGQGRRLPDYVQREFEDDLRCGRLEHGFLRVRCGTCGKRERRSETGAAVPVHFKTGRIGKTPVAHAQWQRALSVEGPLPRRHPPSERKGRPGTADAVARGVDAAYRSVWLKSFLAFNTNGCHPWGHGTTAGMQEVEQRMEQLPRGSVGRLARKGWKVAVAGEVFRVGGLKGCGGSGWWRGMAPRNHVGRLGKGLLYFLF